MKQTPWVCQRLQRFPYVCNRCSRKLSCSKSIVLYDAYEADVQARKLRTSSRSKPKLSHNQMKQLDKLVSPLIQNKQSLYHVYQSVDAIPVSQSTLRRYIDKGYLAARNIDLPRTIRFPNKKQQSRRRKRINVNILKNRTYQDFKDYNHSQKRVVLQLDCVIGKLSDKKCILTLFEPQSRFQWGVLMYRTANAVNAYLSQLIKQLKEHQCLFFDCILVDNGSEFQQLPLLEIDEHGEQLFRIFYCDPYSAYQRGGCERNHEFIRYCIKKGESFHVVYHHKIMKVLIKLKNKPTQCPVYQSSKRSIKDYRNRQINHALFTNVKCILIYCIRRYQCQTCFKNYDEDNPFIPPNKRLSTLTIIQILKDLKRVNEVHTSIANRYYTTNTNVINIFD